jgi:hypothetical protein
VLCNKRYGHTVHTSHLLYTGTAAPGTPRHDAKTKAKDTNLGWILARVAIAIDKAKQVLLFVRRLTSDTDWRLNPSKFRHYASRLGGWVEWNTVWECDYVDLHTWCVWVGLWQTTHGAQTGTSNIYISLFIYDLTTPSVAQTKKRRMINELERVWKKMVVA